MGNVDKAKEYAQHVLDHQEEHCEENILAASRFLRDLDNPEFEMDEDMVDFVVHFIETQLSTSKVMICLRSLSVTSH